MSIAQHSVDRLPEASRVKLENFKYADELGITLPQLVLGIEVNPMSDRARAYRFVKSRRWVWLAHQTAGLCCNQHYLYATLLTPKSAAVLQGMNALAQKWLDSNVGWAGVSLDTANEYRQDLDRLFGADCNSCHQDFEEAFYPADLEFLPKLAADQLPENLDDLIEWDSGLERAMGCVGRFRLLIVSNNSD